MRSHNLRGSIQIAVIGGNGFIGRSFIHRLSSYSNLRIFSLDRRYNYIPIDTTKYKAIVHQITMDVSNEGALNAWLSAHPVDVIVYAAGFENPTDGLSVTCVDDTRALYGLSKTLASISDMQLEQWESPPYFLYLSSTSVYGPIKSKRVETDREYPGNYTGMIKLTSEDLVKRICTKIGSPWGILRLSEVYGKRHNKELRKQHYWTGYLSYYLDKIVRQEETISVFSPNSLIDLVDINYVTLAMRHFIENQVEGIFNVASGDPIKIKHLISKIESEYDSINTSNPVRKFEYRKDLQIENMAVSTSKLHSILPYDLNKYKLDEFIPKYIKARQYEIAKDLVIEDTFSDPLILDSTPLEAREQYNTRQVRRKIVYSKIREIGGEEFFKINIGNTVKRYNNLLNLTVSEDVIDKSRIEYQRSKVSLGNLDKEDSISLFPETNEEVYNLLTRVEGIDLIESGKGKIKK